MGVVVRLGWWGIWGQASLGSGQGRILASLACGGVPRSRGGLASGPRGEPQRFLLGERQAPECRMSPLLLAHPAPLTTFLLQCHQAWAGPRPTAPAGLPTALALRLSPSKRGQAGSGAPGLFQEAEKGDDRQGREPPGRLWDLGQVTSPVGWDVARARPADGRDEITLPAGKPAPGAGSAPGGATQGHVRAGADLAHTRLA